MKFMFKTVFFTLVFLISSVNAFAQQATPKPGASNANTNTRKKEAPVSSNEEGKVIHLDKSEFLKKVFNYETSKEWKYVGDKPCLLDFYAHWCGPCRMISPFLDQLAEEYKGKIYIYKINTDQERELATIFGASSIPLLVFIPNNNEQPQASRGALPKEEIKRAIDVVLLGKK